MNLALTLFSMKNKIMGSVFPVQTAENAKNIFLTPKRHPVKAWEEENESKGKRIQLDNGLSAITWGKSKRKVLLVHGWESRATQMSGFVEDIVEAGFQVIALDAPAHGNSEGKQANPLTFANAVVQINSAIGPFDAIIGHSMGGSAVAIALSENVETKKVVLISSPSSIENALKRFARYIGLPENSTLIFLNKVGESVGRSAHALNIARLIQSNQSKGLIIHDQNDLEVPFEDAKDIKNNWKGATLISTQGYGHRTILRKKDVWCEIIKFLS